jgi:quinol monooxygenase YgiN
MIIVAGEVRFGAGEIERLAPLLRASVEGARAEDGCLSYCYGRDALDPDLLVVSERWRDEASLEAHLKQPHLLQFIGAVREAEVERMSVKMYAAGEGKTLLGA